MNQRPRMTEADEEQAIALFDAGCTAEEVHEQMPEWSAGTFRNRKMGWKDRIAALKRAKALRLEEIPMARQEARVNANSDVVLKEWLAYRAAYGQCWIPNPTLAGHLRVPRCCESGAWS